MSRVRKRERESERKRQSSAESGARCVTGTQGVHLVSVCKLPFVFFVVVVRVGVCVGKRGGGSVALFLAELCNRACVAVVCIMASVHAGVGATLKRECELSGL